MTPLAELFVGLRRRLVLFSLLAFVTVCGADGQALAPVLPLQANLLGPLDASRVKVGSHVLARVAAPWSHDGCQLRAGALVEGHVSEVERRTKTDKKSALHVTFDSADCDGHPATPFKTTVVALLGPLGTAAPNGESGMGEDPPLAEIPALTTGQTAAGAARAAAEGTPGNSFRSVSTMSAINTFAVTARTTRSLPKSWVLGQVVDCPKMNLTVRTGVDGGSIVWSMSTDARLEARTTLIMLPTPEGGQFGANGTTPAAATPDGAAGKVSAIDAAQPFNRLDVTREEIAVYRSSDGAKLSSVVTDDFVLAQNAYALSPAGDQMAVVGRQSIQFYPVKLR